MSSARRDNEKTCPFSFPFSIYVIALSRLAMAHHRNKCYHTKYMIFLVLLFSKGRRGKVKSFYCAIGTVLNFSTSIL